MRSGDGKVIRVGDWVRIMDSYHEGEFAEVIRVGNKAAHIYIRVMGKNGLEVFMTIRASKVKMSSHGEVLLYKLENA